MSLSSILFLDSNFIGCDLLSYLKFLGGLPLNLKFLDLFSSFMVVTSADATAAFVWVLYVQFPNIKVIDILVIIEVR